ncbi:MAG: hypothetical protein AAGI49_08435, partial [Bacteroidota bacterium]
HIVITNVTGSQASQEYKGSEAESSFEKFSCKVTFLGSTLSVCEQLADFFKTTLCLRAFVFLTCL